MKSYQYLNINTFIFKIYIITTFRTSRNAIWRVNKKILKYYQSYNII